MHSRAPEPGAGRPPGVGSGQCGETWEGRSLLDGLGGVTRPRRGVSEGGACGPAGAGRRGQSWIPEATDASVPSLREVVSRPRQVGDGMRPGSEAVGPRSLSCWRRPRGVPHVRGRPGAGHFGPREGGCQPPCEPQARAGAGAEEPGRSPPGGNAPFRRS